jgi:serine/threonine-protein kinase RsbW
MRSGPETLVIKARLSELERVGAWTETLAGRLGLAPSTSFAIQLCFEEAISNAIRHGMADHAGNASEGDIHLSVDRRDDHVLVTIEDGGIPFDPREAVSPAIPAGLEDATIGGQGIHLMKQFAQHMDYERRAGMNRLTLCFDLPAD